MKVLRWDKLADDIICKKYTWCVAEGLLELYDRSADRVPECTDIDDAFSKLTMERHMTKYSTFRMYDATFRMYDPM